LGGHAAGDTRHEAEAIAPACVGLGLLRASGGSKLDSNAVLMLNDWGNYYRMLKQYDVAERVP
jgi:hypothetical protein